MVQRFLEKLKVIKAGVYLKDSSEWYFDNIGTINYYSPNEIVDPLVSPAHISIAYSKDGFNTRICTPNEG